MATTTPDRQAIEAALSEIEREHIHSVGRIEFCRTCYDAVAAGHGKQNMAENTYLYAWPCPPIVAAQEVRRLWVAEDAAIGRAAEYRCVYCPHGYGVHSGYRCWRCTEEGLRGDSADHPFTTPADLAQERYHDEFRQRVDAKRAATFRDAGEPDQRALLP